jgi:HlyD family secretion protein
MVIIAVLVVVALGYAFWPRPVLVDMAEVKRGPIVVTIDEDARTQVHNTYVVSTPIAGRLMRVTLEPGDTVVQGETIVARMLPTNPAALDIRTKEQAQAAVQAAQAALRLAQADYMRANADYELAQENYDRTKQLWESDTVSKAALDRAERELQAARAALDTATAAISMRAAELKNAQAQLIGFDDQRLAAALGAGQLKPIPLKSPETGTVLRVMQESETVLPPGTPIMEIGNIEEDLEVVVELLSTDAVRVKPGDRVIIDKWGGDEPLSGVVDRIDPWGFTKFSALGVEEQRVRVYVRFTDPPQSRGRLGHGFRVEARIVIWEEENAVIVPSSALFRDAGSWAVFVVSDGVVEIRRVEVGQNNGVTASIASGLEAGERIVLYPGSELEPGIRVAQRQTG